MISGEEDKIERDIESTSQRPPEEEQEEIDIDMRELEDSSSLHHQQAVAQLKKKGNSKLNKEKMSNKNNNSHNDSKSMRRRLVSYEELPEYMKENEFIRGYYRSEWPLSHAFLSLFSWHNETINIWTHLVGFFAFLGFTLVHLGHVPEVANLLALVPWSISLGAVENVSCGQASLFGASSPLIKLSYHTTDTSELLSGPSPPAAAAARWPFFVFLGGSMFCFLSSSFCHLLCCHSHRLNLLLARLDYSGIAIMIVSSFFPPIYYIFQCEPLYRTAYLTAISAFGILTVLTLFAPELSRGKFRGYRALLFVAMGLFGIIPAVHGTVVNWSEPRRDVTLAYEGAMAAMYLIGTGFYVSRVPERWWPGMFDLTGHSHQIFHVFVIFGALAHYGAALIFLEYRDAVGCGGSS